MAVPTGVCVAGEASPARNRAEVEAVLAKAPRTAVNEPKPLHVVLLAGGLVAVHAATSPRNKQQHAAGWSLSKHRFPRAAEVLGVGGYETYRHGSVEVKVVKFEHPLCEGLPETTHFDDETYRPPTPQMDGLELLATSDEITDDQGHKSPQPVLWTYTCGKGRVVGCQPGHSTWTFDDPYFRIALLRGAAWAAGQSLYRFDGLVLPDARVTK